MFIFLLPALFSQVIILAAVLVLVIVAAVCLIILIVLCRKVSIRLSLQNQNFLFSVAFFFNISYFNLRLSLHFQSDLQPVPVHTVSSASG